MKINRIVKIGIILFFMATYACIDDDSPLEYDNKVIDKIELKNSIKIDSIKLNDTLDSEGVEVDPPVEDEE
ncbi:hypothetical protein GO491_00780 [Flavobacteriaceae bacterium Ap0902]|nr:hypothetical protein [Flavobacteriaceae bacterium Ap0902]